MRLSRSLSAIGQYTCNPTNHLTPPAQTLPNAYEACRVFKLFLYLSQSQLGSFHITFPSSLCMHPGSFGCVSDPLPEMPGIRVGRREDGQTPYPPEIARYPPTRVTEEARHLISISICPTTAGDLIKLISIRTYGLSQKNTLTPTIT